MTGWWPRVGIVLTAAFLSVSTLPPLSASLVKTEKNKELQILIINNWQAHAKVPVLDLFSCRHTTNHYPPPILTFLSCSLHNLPVVSFEHLTTLFHSTWTQPTRPNFDRKFTIFSSYNYLLNEWRTKRVEKIRTLMLQDFLQTTVGLNISALYIDVNKCRSISEEIISW